jgi:hypothetical protein
MKRSMLAFLVMCVLAGCKEESGTSSVPAGGAQGPNATTTAPAADDHANAVDLGEKTVGAWKLKAKQDGAVKAGGEGAFDLIITGGKPKAVRFWVGTESGEGSVKAKADEETTDHWHTHVEVPDPLPPGSKFWAEVEPPQGERITVSFDMKP